MLVSVEQISKYHPDKYADQISDAILGAAYAINPNAKVAVETMVKDRTVILAGEISGVVLPELRLRKIVVAVADSLNYRVSQVINLIGVQSVEIKNAVEAYGEVNAGDQGIMVGYATRKTPSGLPFGMDLANKIIATIEDLVPEGIIKGDAKTQVTYDDVTLEVHKVVVSACHHTNTSLESLKDYLNQKLWHLVDIKKLIINPAGAWHIGGPEADAGLTGRKIVADQYGPTVPVGGGAFSGKDLTKVDRSGAYVARNMALDVLKGFDVEEVTIQLAYIIGKTHPISMAVKCDKGDEWNQIIRRWLSKYYDLSVEGLIKSLNIQPQDYVKIAAGCHYRNKYVGEWN